MDVTSTQACPDTNTLWFILAIFFIVLFLTSFAINIFLWVIRQKNLLKLQEDLQKQFNAQSRESQTNVFYGGTKTTVL
jgi:hypothetical protein